MPETASLSLLAVKPGNFSDEVLSEIINALALRGEDPIAQLAAFIKILREFRVPFETEATRIQKDWYAEELFNLLCLALSRERLVDGLGRLDLEKLRSWAKRSR
jgi:hypothetical protein